MKKILCSLFAILLASCIYGTTNSLGATLTEQEARQILDKIPNKIELEIKESEFELADGLLEEKIKEIIGTQIEFGVYIYDAYMYKEEIDIKKADVVIFGEKPDSEEDDIEKKIEISYSNSKEYNEEDKKYVEDKTSQIEFDRRKQLIIDSNGAMEIPPQELVEISWQNEMNVENIKVVQQFRGFNPRKCVCWKRNF